MRPPTRPRATFCAKSSCRRRIATKPVAESPSLAPSWAHTQAHGRTSAAASPISVWITPVTGPCLPAATPSLRAACPWKLRCAFLIPVKLEQGLALSYTMLALFLYAAVSLAMGVKAGAQMDPEPAEGTCAHPCTRCANATLSKVTCNSHGQDSSTPVPGPYSLEYLAHTTLHGIAQVVRLNPVSPAGRGRHLACCTSRHHCSTDAAHAGGGAAVCRHQPPG